MTNLIDLHLFQASGQVLMLALLGLSALLGASGLLNLGRTEPWREKESRLGLLLVNVLFGLGFALIAWLHWRINRELPLTLPDQLVGWLNNGLAEANQGAAYGLPLYDPSTPPRYVIPLWIENEKYYFWFMGFALLTLLAWRRPVSHRFRGGMLALLALQVGLLFTLADPFAAPLPRFFGEIAPWFAPDVAPMARMGMFMKLYPRMIFYYNAHYMWLHPPLLFFSYACITLTFLASLFMLTGRSQDIEQLGYDSAKFGYLLLTLGMLLGYPWALQAWGPNWWWDPKICSSIMMWAIYSTYLHTRLYANKTSMWYFSSFLGILCFAAMIFTFLASFLFPGEHTFQ